ncbi:MAG: membrane dipeptidase [Ardenticatenaceae bacterium]|nr:membrane dipeptidase [Ardenticatenaceae bacterium]
MNNKQLRYTTFALASIAAGTAGLLWWAGKNLEGWLNRVQPEPLPDVTPAAQQLHQDSLVVDMHCDSLLFGRDLLSRSATGHIDLPRLQASNVAIQVFAAATRIPLGFNVTRTPAHSPDLLRIAGAVQASRMAWQSPLGRALHMAQRLHEMAEQSGGQLRVLHNQEELAQLLAARKERPFLTGGILAIEGTQALNGNPANVDKLYAAGYRIIGLTHFYDTEFAGSAHGWRKGGLTAKGLDLLVRMGGYNILLDVAHLSPQALEDVLTVWQRPLLMSHGGVRATGDNPRNLSDDQIRAIAATGGVIGVGFWETAVGGRHPRHIIAALQHIIDLVGDDHAALGSDFDGGITTAFDAAQLAILTQQMLDTGFPETTIRKILGGNALRLLQSALPAAAV